MQRPTLVVQRRAWSEVSVSPLYFAAKTPFLAVLLNDWFDKGYHVYQPYQLCDSCCYQPTYYSKQ